MRSIFWAWYQEFTTITALIIESVQEFQEQSITKLFCFLGPREPPCTQQALSSVTKTRECWLYQASWALLPCACSSFVRFQLLILTVCVCLLRVSCLKLTQDIEYFKIPTLRNGNKRRQEMTSEWGKTQPFKCPGWSPIAFTSKKRYLYYFMFLSVRVLPDASLASFLPAEMKSWYFPCSWPWERKNYWITPSTYCHSHPPWGQTSPLSLTVWSRRGVRAHVCEHI